VDEGCGLKASTLSWASFYGSLWISKLQFLIQFFSAVKFLQFFVTNTLDPKLDPDPDLDWWKQQLDRMLDPDPD